MKETIQKTFVKFLKREGIFEGYKKNWSLRDGESIASRYDYFKHAFPWCYSEEKHAYWFCFDKKWKKHLNSLRTVEYETRCSSCGKVVKKEFWIKKDLNVNLICHRCGGF